MSYDNIESEYSTNPKELDVYVGIYKTEVYGISEYYAVKREKSLLNVDVLLYRGKINQARSGLFFGRNGEAFRFEKDKMKFDLLTCNRITNPIVELKELVIMDPNNRKLSDISLNTLIDAFKFLNKEKKVKEVFDILEKLGK